MPNISKTKRHRTPTKGNGYDADRRRIYNTARWRKLRAWKIACDPLCEVCKSKGLTVPAEDVHHVVSFMSTDDPVQRKHLAYDYDNLMSLCKECHQFIHNSSDYIKKC